MSTTPVPPVLLSISPGNSPQFQAVLQPVNAGPFLARMVVWTSSDPESPVTQNESDLTGLTVTLAISSQANVGASISLAVRVTNQDGSVVSATDVLAVVAPGTSPPAFIPATGAVINQTV
jgi:hypothetical protein